MRTRLGRIRMLDVNFLCLQRISLASTIFLWLTQNYPMLGWHEHFSVFSCLSMFKSTTLQSSTHSWMPIVYGSALSVIFISLELRVQSLEAVDSLELREFEVCWGGERGLTGGKEGRPSMLGGKTSRFIQNGLVMHIKT